MEILNIIMQYTPMEWILLASSLIMLIGSIGLFRFKDVYTRIHAAGLVTIGGVCLSLVIISISIFVENFLTFELIRILIIITVILVTSPIISQAISESAYKRGIKPKLGKTSKRRLK